MPVATRFQRAALAVVAVSLLLAGCRDAGEPLTPAIVPSSPAVAEDVLFQDVGPELGFVVAHDAGSEADFPMPQIMGSGGAMFDANGDGRLDLLVIPGQPAACPLWLQTEDGRFQDATTVAQLQISHYGMGAAIGDVDNDGDLDVLVTCDGGDHLFRNDGQARFTDVTESAGVSDPKWSTAASFFDCDRDGWLDLIVVNYVDYLPGSICQDGTGRRDYCGPQPFDGTVDRLYRNLGASGRPGVFEDVTVACGLAAGRGKGLGVVTSDFNGDDLPDILVANDQEPNRLWVQQPDGTFVDEAMIRGCAVNLHGRSQANMGTAWSDLDRDGLFDLFITHLRGETNTLWRQMSPGLFTDATADARLGSPSLDFTGFGVAAFDIELDGDLDLLVANGRVMRSPLVQLPPTASHWDRYSERNQIFRNEGRGVFAEVRDGAFTKPIEIWRGLAAGDIDNDGDIDLLATSINGPTRLYRNVAPRTGHWLQVRAIDPALERDAFGAKITVRAGADTWSAEVQPNLGYLTANDVRVHFGLGEAFRVDSIEVNWPGRERSVERFEGEPVDRMIELRRGEGVSANPAEDIP